VMAAGGSVKDESIWPKAEFELAVLPRISVEGPGVGSECGEVTVRLLAMAGVVKKRCRTWRKLLRAQVGRRAASTTGKIVEVETLLALLRKGYRDSREMISSVQVLVRRDRV
jgi:hypothetical protein